MSDVNPWNTSAASSHSANIPSLYPSSTPSDSQPQHQNQEYNQHEAFITITPEEAASSKASPYHDDSPPSYEAVINKDVVQTHDTYEHLQGPLSQHSSDIKTAIPSESLPWSSDYQSAGVEGSSSGSSSNGPSRTDSSFPHAFAPSGPIFAATVVPPSIHGITHSPTTTQAPPLGLRGQIALDTEETGSANPMYQPLRTGSDTDSASENDPLDKSYWSRTGDEQAWINLFYMTFILLPWTCFCYAWTITVVMFALIMMIIPPIGYFVTIFAVTSWRALARVDLVLSSALVSEEVRQRYPLIKSVVYLEAEHGPVWMPPQFFGYELPLPGFVQGKLQSRHVARSRRPKSLWRRGSKHWWDTISDRHTICSMYYFTVGKAMFAVLAFLVVVTYSCLTLPFVVCLLPSLLSLANVLAKWQYRWAVCWLNGNAAPFDL